MILLIQTHDLSRYAAAEILRDAGYDVMEADNAIQALALLDNYAFRLIISDILMPVLGGFALAARVRLKWPEMPILLTGYLSQNGAQAILKQPVEFLHKPIEATALTATVERLLPNL